MNPARKKTSPVDPWLQVLPISYREAPVGLCMFDTDLRYRHINEWLAAINGIPVEEHLGRTINQILPSVARRIEAQLRHVIETGQPIVRALVHAEVPAEPGVTKTFEHHYHAVRSADATIVGVSLVVQDITERRRAEEERERYKSMVTASSDLMAFVDGTYTYLAVNQALCDELRRTEQEIIGHTVAEVIGKRSFEMLKPEFDRCLAGEQVTLDFWWDSGGRGHRHVDVQYDPFFEPDGSVSGVLVDARDTTHGKEIEQQLERSVALLEAANRELRMFSDALAHDLKAPLLTMTQFSEHLHGTASDSLDEQQEDYLQRIRTAGKQMTRIIDDLRDLAEADRVEITQEEVDVSLLGREIIDELRARAPDRDLRFEVAHGITAVADRNLLRLLLSRLLRNAWKYSARNDVTRVELGVVGDESAVPTYYVRDNGIGFDNAERERIFRAGERLHTAAEFPGTGLGLAVVERIVHRHNGHVWAEGNPGEGATFRFTLARSVDRRKRRRRTSSSSRE